MLGSVMKLQTRVLRRGVASFPLLKAQPTHCLWGRHQIAFYGSLLPSHDISVEYKHGRPVLALPLPSKREKCVFFLRPMLMTINDLIQDLKKEDPGIESAVVLTTEGEKVSCSTSVDTLLQRNFQLCINDMVYNVHSAQQDKDGHGPLLGVDDMKNMVHLLYSALHLPVHQQIKEVELRRKLDSLQQELMPLEMLRTQVDRRAELSSSWALWTGLALLSVQGGALAWLTWWVYSWDIMEPVTYFITYSTSIAVFSYYVLTKQDYVYPDAKDRQFLHYFHKGAKRKHFDVTKYNELKEEMAVVEEDLRRLRSPNQLQLPVQQIQPKE
ncbi:calcium uniporter regulatory subunit MCUb, mitochondrial-like [Denticeps clupeoides]|uniref:Calcium uniporter regulatory subunit MCUb n=1 Tax=Denticeps clupeoides TaxID=299321 RepID=A0AAY4AVA7_9TELE|nr:calcium uniporter regulatory subunit MCUb, mitochondrial [Denticeps clupeoides]